MRDRSKQHPDVFATVEGSCQSGGADWASSSETQTRSLETGQCPLSSKLARVSLKLTGTYLVPLGSLDGDALVSRG